MLKCLSIVVILSMIGGCSFTSAGDAYRTRVHQKSKKAAAVSLENAEWLLCRAASVGAVKDRYGISTNKSIAYHILCQQDPANNLISPSGMSTGR